MCRFLSFIILLASFAPTHSHAAEPEKASAFNPETVLLSHVTLTRPQHWQWVSTQPHEINVLMEVIFSVKDPQDPRSEATVCFNHMKPNTAIAAAGPTAHRWQTWFAEVRSAAPFSETKIIGTNKLSFLEITGTYKGPPTGSDPKLFTDYTMLGAHMEDGEGSIIVRFTGPTKLVEKNKAAFTGMIEQMLQPK
ncbi:MAG: hypothetical protein JWM68_4866 [Verrucomicrobiales bacterium]|nr:hypothetical protein [Verrucomicrobiales bacterium]